MKTYTQVKITAGIMRIARIDLTPEQKKEIIDLIEKAQESEMHSLLQAAELEEIKRNYDMGLLTQREMFDQQNKVFDGE